LSAGRKKIVRGLQLTAAGGMVLLAVALLSTVFYGKAADLDFIGYWISGRLMKEHANPYSRPAILQLEEKMGSDLHVPIVMRNPPWSLFLVAPLGFMSMPIAAFVWLLAMIVALVVSIRLLSAGSKPPPVIVYLFAPVLYTAMSGQTPLFFLLGIAVFYHFYERRPWLAGAALVLAAIKPHLFVLFWPVLLIDCIRNRRYRILAGAVVGLVAATAVAIAFDHHVVADYLTSMRDEHMELHYMPNIPCSLRMLVPGRPEWLQVLPAVLGVFWAIWFYWRKRAAWDWTDQGALLLCISVLVSPYSWPFDQVLFLPAILKVLSKPVAKSTVAVLVALSGIAAVMILKFSITSPVYVWTGPAWLGWYLWARQRTVTPVATEPVLVAS
jgi:Glycosyltransferase family 87